MAVSTFSESDIAQELMRPYMAYYTPVNGTARFLEESSKVCTVILVRPFGG